MPATPRTNLAQSALAVAWGVVGAVFTAAAWAVGLFLAQHQFSVNLATLGLGEHMPEAANTLTVIGAAVGFSVGLLYGSLFGHRSSSLAQRGLGAVVWSLGLTVATALGGFPSVVAVAETEGWLWPPLASSLGFSVTGLLAGLGGYLGSRWPAKTPTDESEEEAGQAPGPGTVSVPPEAEPSVYAVALRLLPGWAVSAAALVTAAAIKPSHAALGFFAVAVLGFATSLTLRGQELRIRDLERRLRRTRER